MSKNLIIVQARMSSTRLPGKVLRPIWKDYNLLDLIFQELKGQDFPIVLATTINSNDDLLVQWANKNDVLVFRGSEDNVLKRFIDCAQHFGSENIVRVCSDNPFLRLDKVSHYFEQLEAGMDYFSFANGNGLPAIKTHWGLFVEGVSFRALEKSLEIIDDNAYKELYQEHVTNFIYQNPMKFSIELEKAPGFILDRNNLRFTIDTEEDFLNMSKLLELLDGKTNTDLELLVKTADTHPAIINKMALGINRFSK